MTLPLPSTRRAARALLPLAAAGALLAPSGAEAAPKAVAGEIIVRYAPGTAQSVRAATNRAAGVHQPATSGPGTRLVKVKPGESTASAMRRLRARKDVLSATPNAIARAAGYVPNDPGPSKQPGGWVSSQWNFQPTVGVNAPDAWQNLINAGKPGGKGTIVAVVDSGVAYRTRGPYRASPDFSPSQFVRGHDFRDNDDKPNDASGHGTHVASTIAERTNNAYGLTGLAYGARIMPIRVLNSEGIGDVDDIAKGVRYAVNRGADVINLSMEFDPLLRGSDLPSLVDAINYAKKKNVVVVAAAGNEGVGQVPYPAAASSVIAVGATTIRRCIAEYSNFGSRIDIAAPGGGADAAANDPGCDPLAPPGPNIFQVTFSRSPRSFGYPDVYQGTSMAAPHVSATAALVIASGVLGPRPTPAKILKHLQNTATDLGPVGKDSRYGAGLLDAAKATTPPGTPLPAG